MSADGNKFGVVTIDGVRFVPTANRDFVTAQVVGTATFQIDGKHRFFIELKDYNPQDSYRMGLRQGDKILIYWQE